MAIFKKSKPSPPSASVAADAIEQNVQVVEAATTEKDQVAESAGKKEENEVKDEKKKPKASLGNYFVRC